MHVITSRTLLEVRALPYLSFALPLSRVGHYSIHVQAAPVCRVFIWGFRFLNILGKEPASDPPFVDCSAYDQGERCMFS